MLLNRTIFFFKQETAYEIYYGVVGSEMCIRDSDSDVLIILPIDSMMRGLEIA